jgi:L-ascorbate metabolism protein UlaG (beta-lactamase superfamily)
MAPAGSVVADPALDAAVVQHFRDGRFFNPGVRDHGFLEAMQWMRNRKPGAWRKWIPSTPGPPPPAQILGAELRATFVNHATVLLQTEGCNILTDPVWSRRVSPVQFTGPERHRAPGIRFEDLPPIHALLISHNHYDHLDLPTLRRLAPQQPTVFCPLGVGKLLRHAGLKTIHELDWDQHHEWGALRMHCVRAQHFSARTPFDRNRTLWCGWVMETPSGRVYFAGDSGYGDFFASIGRQFAPLRLALLPIGAFDPEWFMGPVHMTPDQAVEVWRQLDRPATLPIHYGTFALADDGETDPIDRLSKALANEPHADRFAILPEGEARPIPWRPPEYQ